MVSAVPRSLLLWFVYFCAAAHEGQAQRRVREVVAGRVADSAGAGVSATVKVTRAPDRLTLGTVANAAGHYRVVFDTGNGDYLVYVSAPGMKTVRRRVTRTSVDGDTLVADFTLAPDLAVLAAVRVTAVAPVRASNSPPTAARPEVGAHEAWRDGAVGVLAPDLAGDLNAMAARQSNLTIGPDGPSVLGSSSASNRTTLNGGGVSFHSLPRAAQVQTRFTTATYDPSRGGFAGVNVDMHLGAGSRFYQQRRAFLTVAPGGIHGSDPRGRLGTRQIAVRGSVGADGELIRDALTYNLAIEGARSVALPASLVAGVAPLGTTAGLSDSVAHVLAIASQRAIPLLADRASIPQQRTNVSFIGRLDDTRDSLAQRSITTFGRLATASAVGITPFTSGSALDTDREASAGGQLHLGYSAGAHGRILSEFRIGGEIATTDRRPQVRAPSVQIALRTASDSGAVVGEVVRLGGSAGLTNERAWSLEGGNETVWNAGGRRHRFKTLVWQRVEGQQRDGSDNAFGTLTYPSLEAFAQNVPSSFTRRLAQETQQGGTWNGAVAVAHQYSPSRYFGLLYGARLQAERDVARTLLDPRVAEALGIADGPPRVGVRLSPRIGFTYTYNRAADNVAGESVTPLGTLFRSMSGVVRGGIGEFRDLRRAGPAVTTSAGAQSTVDLTCVAQAVPAIEWTRLSDETGIPSACAPSEAPLAERSAAVRFLTPSYAPARSWRASLDWTTNLGGVALHVGTLASYNLGLGSAVDANFRDTIHFVLAEEANRPVFVPPSAIDPRSGEVSAASARRSSLFAGVHGLRSDLHGYGGQVSVRLTPDVITFGSGRLALLSGAYTYSKARRQYRGFDGLAFGDPGVVEWSTADGDIRHTAVVTVGLRTRSLGVASFSGRLQSGVPFTPVVLGDVNGDGSLLDRAFVPMLTGDPVGHSSGLRSLMTAGSSAARECLRRYEGRPAERNGCRGSWSGILNAHWSPPVPRRWRSRVAPSIYFQNILAGLDQLVHSPESLRGWGFAGEVDPVLLRRRAFDGNSRAFAYEVNSRFAGSRPSLVPARTPFRIVLDLSLELSTPLDVQQLRRATEPVRTGDTYRRRNASDMTAFFLKGTSSLPRLLLALQDSLLLTPSQVGAIQRAEAAYASRVRQVYTPLGAFLAASQDNLGTAELAQVQLAHEAYWSTFWDEPARMYAELTPIQRSLVPFLKALIDLPAESRRTLRLTFGYAVMPAD